MGTIRCTLLADGSSDKALIPILEWIVREHSGDRAVHFEWADLRRLSPPPRLLRDRIGRTLEIFPCHLLFVHRDAEGQQPDQRYGEISAAIQDQAGSCISHVGVVPVRMQESWLLLDPVAIRQAAGNPNGRADLNLPSLRRIESLPDPKEVLYQSLRVASGLSGRRLKGFQPSARAYDVSRYMRDFSMLRGLPAFVRLEDDVRAVMAGDLSGNRDQLLR